MWLDNKAHGKVGDMLRQSIQKDARLSFISSFFSVYGFSALRQELGRAQALRLLVPATDDPVGAANGQFRIPGLAGSEADRRHRNALNLTLAARECAQWLEQKAEIRSVSSPVPWNMFHVENPGGGSVAIHGSSPFTSTGLGFVPLAWRTSGSVRPRRGQLLPRNS